MTVPTIDAQRALLFDIATAHYLADHFNANLDLRYFFKPRIAVNNLFVIQAFNLEETHVTGYVSSFNA